MTEPATQSGRPLRIGFLGPALWSIEGRGNGIIAQARFQAAALGRLGHEVVWLNPWDPADPSELDVVQFFVGGYATHWIEHTNRQRVRRLVWAPIIDTNAANRSYRFAAWLGTRHPKVSTVPGSFRQQGLASDVVVVRSRHERLRVVEGLGIPDNKVSIVLNGVDPPVPADPAIAKAALGLPDEFALHLSIYHDQRKNVLNLIRAVGPLGIPLVIAGAAAACPMLDQIKAEAGRFPSIRLVGFLERGIVESLYAGCRVFALPSVHEGTGLAALEAAARGANIVITRHGGTRDYFEDMAEYTDPGDVAGIRGAFERAWAAPRNDRLREHVVNKLTWDRSALALVRAYGAGA